MTTRQLPGVGEGSADPDGRILRCVATLLHPSAASAACDTELGGIPRLHGSHCCHPSSPGEQSRHGRDGQRRGTRRALAGLVEEELASDRHGVVGAAR